MMDVVSVKRKIKVNGDFCELKFTKEELTNSLFSLKFNFMPNFNSESEYNESWFEDTKYKAGTDDDSQGTNIDVTVGEEAVVGNPLECKGRRRGLAIMSTLVAKFEFEKKSNDGDYLQKINSHSPSQMGEEESIKVVVDSIDIDTEEEEVGDKEGVGMCEVGYKQKTQSSSDPIESLDKEELVIKKLKEMEKKDKAENEAKSSMGRNEGVGKKRITRELVNKERVDFLAILETKMEGIDRKLCSKLWGSKEYQWVAKDFVGMSGGLVCLWNSNNIRMTQVWEGENFIAIQGVWVAETPDSELGPKPFRFFDVWFEHEGCGEVIREAWGKAKIQGWVGFWLKEKLKITKEALKMWSKSIVIEIDNKISNATTETAQLDLKEGINGLVLNATQKGLLEGVEVGCRGFRVSHLQYADDMLLFGTTTKENIWAMKGIQRTFELVSRLKINFSKSQLIGIGVKEEWLDKMAWERTTKSHRWEVGLTTHGIGIYNGDGDCIAGKNRKSKDEGYPTRLAYQALAVEHGMEQQGVVLKTSRTH
ncbi:hypothetical protein SLEP1_g37157 [Rubroshorea leprosula]|uniref:Reverse transcriptase domain-containing protein n=1 Tax=Rubroshorea leprosula TaxID=152421 RepID=A0AAV5KUH1_9ROSI|nr:hypothetical protein SLEP1_g37157 [Rubroshorea leprosula]